MTDYNPISRRAYCADDHWRAMIDVVDGSNHRQVEAEVDLHDAAHPRFTLAGGQPQDASPAFVTAFRALPAVPADLAPQREQICGQPPAQTSATPAVREPSSPLWGAVPVLAGGLQYIIDREGRHDLNRIPAPNGFGTLGTFANGAYVAGQGLFVVSYVPLHRRLSPTMGWVFDGVCLGGAAGFGIAASQQPRGEGTPELSMSLTLASTCIPAMIYGNNETSRDPLRFWLGFGSQLILGGTFAGLGFGGVGRRPTVSGSDMYAPPDMAPGARNTGINPYGGTTYPGIDTDMAILGVVQGAGAVINLIDYMVWSGPGSAGSGSGTHVSVTPLPRGAGLSISGRF